MRFRLLDLMEAKSIGTAYQLSRESNGAIPITTAQRLVNDAKKGAVKRLDLDTIDALCEVLGCEPNALLERDKPKRRKS